MNKFIAIALFYLAVQIPVLAAGVSPLTIDGAKTVDTAESKSLFDNEVLFVDVRKDSDWDAGRIPGALHLDIKKGKFTEEALVSEIAKDEKVVMYCNGEKCPRSSKAAKIAVGWGFTNVYYYRDGFPAWKDAAYPVE